jgi:hypothetical protein
MPMPNERANKPALLRLNRLKSAAKRWNESYFSGQSWTDLRTGAVRGAWAVGGGFVMDRVKDTASAMTFGAVGHRYTAKVIDGVDLLFGLGALGVMAKWAAPTLAAGQEDDGSFSKHAGDQLFDALWDQASTFLMANYTGARREGTQAYNRLSERASYDPASSAEDIKTLFTGIIQQLAELNATTTAAQHGKVPFRYCDDMHDFWAKFFKTLEDIDELKDACAKLKVFADEADKAVTQAKGQLFPMEVRVTAFCKKHLDRGQIAHYTGGTFNVRERSKQCSHAKCYGPA